MLHLIDIYPQFFWGQTKHNDFLYKYALNHSIMYGML